MGPNYALVTLMESILSCLPSAKAISWTLQVVRNIKFDFIYTFINAYHTK